MTARLHVLVGAGGVGKTTLAAGYALALARAGGQVGLLGVDPARRLQTALGLTLPDLEVPVPGVSRLQAALLRPTDCLRRWAEEACDDAEVRERLERNPFFLALADRLAGASDLLAAVRVAEWLERVPRLTDLVVDTAPGLNALAFLERPKSFEALIEGRLVRWLRWVARRRHGAVGEVVVGGTRRLAAGLTRIGGTTLMFELADFVLLVEGVLERMMTRLERAQAWLRAADTSVLLVTAVREDAPAAATAMAQALGALVGPPRAVVLNRALPEALREALWAQPGLRVPAAAAPVVRYAKGALEVQQRVSDAVSRLAPVVVVPAALGLDGPQRLAALERVGAGLRDGLAGAAAPPRRVTA